jgi:hypothetical protein
MIPTRITSTIMMMMMMILTLLFLTSKTGNVVHATSITNGFYGPFTIYAKCAGINFRKLSLFDANFIAQSLQQTYNVVIFNNKNEFLIASAINFYEKIQTIQFTGPTNWDGDDLNGQWHRRNLLRIGTGIGFGIGNGGTRNDIGLFEGNWFNEYGNSTLPIPKNDDDGPPPTILLARIELIKDQLTIEWAKAFYSQLSQSKRNAFRNVKRCSLNYNIILS